MKAARFLAAGGIVAAAGRWLSVAVITSVLALVASQTQAQAPVQVQAQHQVQAPYFCDSQVRAVDPTERAICADKGLQVLHGSLDFELEDAMSQAIKADKIQLLDRLKSEHEPWEMGRGRACPDDATRIVCLRSLYESRRRDLSALLTAEGLMTVAAQAREFSAAEAQRSAAADRDREREAQEQAHAGSSPLDAASQAGVASAASTAQATVAVKPQAAAKAPPKSHDPAEPDKPFNWPGLIAWVAVGLGGFAWWFFRKKRVADKAQSAQAGGPGGAGQGQAGSAKKKWGWVAAAAVLVLIVISKQGELDRASKAVSESGAAAAAPQTASFPSGIWQCGLLGRVEFAAAGVFRNYNPPTNTESNLLLERVGFLGVGNFAMEAADQLRVSVTRQVSVEASPEDEARLGELNDMRLEVIRKFKVENSGRDVVLQETFRSFNGKVKEPSGKRFLCTLQAPSSSPAQAPQIAAVGTLPSEPFATRATQSEPMAPADGEAAVMQDMLNTLDASQDASCRAQGQLLRTIWGYFTGSGEHRFRNEAMKMLGDIERRGCL